jgi:hypothetical protein
MTSWKNRAIRRAAIESQERGQRDRNPSASLRLFGTFTGHSKNVGHRDCKNIVIRSCKNITNVKTTAIRWQK